jgi:hypothetical protein
VSEERAVYHAQASPAQRPPAGPRCAAVVLPVEELQLLYRMRQLRNAGEQEALVRLADWSVDRPAQSTD